MRGRRGALIGTLLVGLGATACDAKPDLATPVPVDSLTCGSPRSWSPGRLPDRIWAALAWCPLKTAHVQPSVPVPSPLLLPSPSLNPPVIVRGDVHKLVAALAKPDDLSGPAMCTMQKMVLPRFWLVDREGQAFEPDIPVARCGQPSMDVTAALGAITRR